MSRSLSTAAVSALYASETGEGFAVLLTLSHAQLDSPLRVAGSDGPITSRGDTFMPYPFKITLPDDAERQSPEARLVIDNVDRQIILALRNLDTAPQVTIEIVRVADPNTVEARFDSFRLGQVSYDMHMVEGFLSLEDFTAEPFPAGCFSPGHFPGLF
jgi:Domain of unknown function (DUF1833)